MSEDYKKELEKNIEKQNSFLILLNHFENSITRTMIYYALLISAASISFMLGLNANIENNKDEVQIIKSEISEEAEGTENKESDINKSVIFGSSKGKYFYYVGCGGENISAKNKVFYKSEADALRAGKKIYSKCE